VTLIRLVLQAILFYLIARTILRVVRALRAPGSPAPRTPPRPAPPAPRQLDIDPKDVIDATYRDVDEHEAKPGSSSPE
jgi:hypothetical protein